jgi:nucleotide-binding universal stress UspA family protein
MKTIVVGVDGSECARLALQHAVREAVLRNARLRVVCAWRIPAGIYGGEGLAGELDQLTLDSFPKHAEETVREAFAEVERTQPSVQCDGESVEGQPAQVLVHEAKGADLIVVGNRGRGEFKSLLLGSASQQVVDHAPAPCSSFGARRERRRPAAER